MSLGAHPSCDGVRWENAYVMRWSEVDDTGTVTSGLVTTKSRHAKRRITSFQLSPPWGAETTESKTTIKGELLYSKHLRRVGDRNKMEEGTRSKKENSEGEEMVSWHLYILWAHQRQKLSCSYSESPGPMLSPVVLVEWTWKWRLKSQKGWTF